MKNIVFVGRRSTITVYIMISHILCGLETCSNHLPCGILCSSVTTSPDFLSFLKLANMMLLLYCSYQAHRKIIEHGTANIVVLKSFHNILPRFWSPINKK